MSALPSILRGLIYEEPGRLVTPGPAEARVTVAYTDTTGRDVVYEFYPEREGDLVRIELEGKGRVIIEANCSMKNLDAS